MIILGLTGSVGMGKSTASDFFSDAGIPVYSADNAVHEIYCRRPVITEIETAFPGITENGIINRRRLADIVFHDRKELDRLEAIVHPYVYKMKSAFLQQGYQLGHHIVVVDIPLLYETNVAWLQVDYVAVVSVPYEIQRERVLRRDGMTDEIFSAILSRQMSDEEKRRRADFIIDADKDFKALNVAVHSVIEELLAA